MSNLIPSEDSIVNCYICGLWEYRSVMLDGNEYFSHQFNNCCSGNNCYPEKRVCHSTCLIEYGLNFCSDCDPNFYDKLDAIFEDFTYYSEEDEEEEEEEANLEVKQDDISLYETF